MPGSGGKEDEINIGMEVVVDPDDPNQKPMTTYVEAQVYILRIGFYCMQMLTDNVYRWLRMTWAWRPRLRRRRRVRPR